MLHARNQSGTWGSAPASHPQLENHMRLNTGSSDHPRETV